MAESGLDVAACLVRVRQRNEDTARALVEHLYPLVFKIVRAHRPRRLDENDLAQEIFMKMFTNLEQYRGVVPFEHWVSRVAVTTCLDRLRAQKRRPELRWTDLTETEADKLDAVLSAQNVPHPSQSLVAREVVGKLMYALSPEDRLVVQQLDLEERSIAEIQAITGWNATLIKVRAFRARRKIKKHLAQMGKAERYKRKD